MNRRTAISLLCSSLCLAAPPRAFAQAAARAKRLGVLPAGVADVGTMWPALRALGWQEGRDLVEVRARPANGLDAEAEELVRQNVDIILTVNLDAVSAAKRATTTIPIVMAVGIDPVAAGLVASLRNPGGNVTGYASDIVAVEGKRTEILKELMPDLKRAAVLTRTGPFWRNIQDARERSYRARGVAAQFIPIAGPEDLAPAVLRAHRDAAKAVVVSSAGEIWAADDGVLLRTANAHRLPVVAVDPDLVRAGAILSLAVSEEEIEQSLVYFIDKILRGAKPANLPVQQPGRFRVAINLQTAQALGIKVPLAVQVRADEVVR